MFRGARRLRFGKGDVLNLPVVVAGVQNENGSCYVLQTALSEETLGRQRRRKRRHALGIEMSRGTCDGV